MTVALIGCDKPKTEDALAMYNAYVNAGGVVISDPYNADKAEVVIDALFGTGMKSRWQVTSKTPPCGLTNVRLCTSVSTSPPVWIR